MDPNGTNTDESLLNTSDSALQADLHQDQENVSDILLEASENGDDQDLEVMRRRIHEMEEEAEKLKQMQVEVERQMSVPGSTSSQSEIYRKVFNCFR